MAAPTYATDLTVIDDFESGDNTLEPSATWTAGRGNTTDTDYPIQSSTHASLVMNTTGKAGLLTDASPITWTSGDYLFGWLIWLAPGAIGTQAQGGLSMLAGSGSGAYKVFYVGGKDFGLYPYGGWQNFVVDPEGTAKAADETIGSPDGDYDFVGVGANVLSQVAKGSPLGMDVFRYGRGELRVASGDGTTPATFTGMAAANDASTARWGLFQAIEGGYKYKGLMILGYAAAVHFVDANKSFVIDNTEYVASSFNAIEIRNASSNVTWTNITVTALGTTSPGTFEVVDNATVALANCTFTDMGTFAFLSNSTVSSTFRNCGVITHGGADMSDSVVVGYEGTAGTAAVVYNINADPNGEMDNMKFTMGTASTHAIEFGSNTPTTISISGQKYTGYNATTGSNPTAASGANDCAIYNNSGKTITINIVGGGDLPSVRNGAGATTVVVLSKGYTLTNIANPSEVTILDRDVSLLDSTGTATTLSFGNAAATEAFGQNFDTGVDGTDGKVERIRIRLRKVGTPTDGVYVSYWLDDTPGAATPDTVSQTLDGADITTSFVEYDFDLQGKWDSSGTVQPAFAIQRTGSVDASNYYQIEYSTTSVITGTRYVLNGTWNSTTGDLLFKAMEAASDNELYHVESVTTGTTTYTHGGTAKTIEVLVASIVYKQVILIDTIGGTDKSVPVLQIPDLVYQNN